MMVPEKTPTLPTSPLRKRRLKQAGMVVLLVLSAVFSLLSFSGMAHAGAAGCEQHPVMQNGHRYYQCTVEVGAGECLRERNVTTFAIEACLRGGTTLLVAKQISLKNHVINGSPIWDVLSNGRMSSDDYINTGRYAVFSPPLPNPQTPTTTPTATPTSTPVASPTVTATPSPSVTPTATPSPSVTPTVTPSPTPAPSATPTSTPAATPTVSGTPPTGVPSRLFADSSPWNVPIGSTVQLDPNSQAMVDQIANGQNHVPAMFDFGMPIYTSTASDPSYTVADPGNDPLFTKEQPIHIPDSAAPSPGSDHWLFIYDQTKNLLFEMWNTSKSGGTWTTQTGDVYSPTGDGVLQIDGSPQSGNGDSYFGGVITTADMARGSINHALSLASQFTSSSFRFPMVASDGHTTGGIPMGARLQLDPSVDCSTLPGASAGEKMVCKALQVYGGYMRDTGGVALSMYFEGEDLGDPSRNPPSGSPGDTGRADGVFGKVGLHDGQDLSAIPWSKLRVLASWNSFTATTSTSTPPLLSSWCAAQG